MDDWMHGFMCGTVAMVFAEGIGRIIGAWWFRR